MGSMCGGGMRVRGLYVRGLYSHILYIRDLCVRGLRSRGLEARALLLLGPHGPTSWPEALVTRVCRRDCLARGGPFPPCLRDSTYPNGVARPPLEQASAGKASGHGTF